MRLAELVETSQRLSETPQRRAKIDLLADLLRRTHDAEIEIAVHYLSGQIRQGRIGLGYASLRDAQGSAAENPSLELSDVDRSLSETAASTGAGSQQRRFALLGALFSRATVAERDFLERLMVGELRQGALEGIMLDGISKASGVGVDRVRRAAMLAGDLAVVARAALENGEAGLAPYNVRLFRPVQPMLAQPADDAAGALAELGDAALEFKLDGARVQVHKSGEDVRIYSRALNDVTPAVPELVEITRALPVKELILDGEAISLLPGGRPQPFQLTMRRFGRKRDLDRVRQELPITPFWFDLLYVDGGSLLDEPQARRFAELDRLARDFVIPHLRTSDPARAEEFLAQALARGHEGIVAKAVDAAYAAGARGKAWLKVKQARTLDLVILAAEWGSGRRKGWLSNLHLGARDTVKGGFAMLGKTFKGLTDEMLAWQTEQFLAIEIGRDSYTVFVEPKIVAEIAFNEIQASPRYPSGLALRFARVKRYRPDKTAQHADTFETVQRLARLGMPAPPLK